MSDPYEKVKGERLTFKGGGLATRSKTIDKKKKKKSKAADKEKEIVDCKTDATPAEYNAAGDIYSIDAAKKMKYDELFPVEAKKFGYVPKTKAKSVEEALDDRVKKKADRYCK